MDRIEKRIASRWLLPGAMLAGLLSPLSGQTDRELPVHRIPNLGQGAEFYFAPDSKRIIGNAKRDGDSSYHVYTLNIDGTDIRRINDRGEDACSFFFPDGQRLLWTSTRDHPELPKGNYSAPEDYPQGAELYTSKLDGSDVRRLTNNTVYDAEASVSPDGKWVLFGRQIGGKMDLWKMRPDGSGEVQITHMEGWQPGGALYLPDSRTILFRAWKLADQGQKGSLPMTIFTIRDDGTGLRQVTHDTGTNWAPHPAPDGRHFAFVKVLPPRNYEIFLGDLESDRQIRLTYSDAFDGFPAISPDGRWLLFSSSRDSAAGTRQMTQYLMDISSLTLAPAAAGRTASSFDRLAAWLPGTYDTFAQADADEARAASYRHVRAILRIVPLREPAFSPPGSWFYLEQALAGEEDRPYRLRVLRLVERAGGVVNEIYKLREPVPLVGAGQHPELLARLKPEALLLEPGCEVRWTAGGDGRLQGSAGEDGACPSAVRGSTHTISRSELTAGKLVSLDQGFDDAGIQKWGPPQGEIGHIFVKRPAGF